MSLSALSEWEKDGIVTPGKFLIMCDLDYAGSKQQEQSGEPMKGPLCAQTIL